MESPSSAARRRAWINSSRQWLAPEELDSEGLPCNLPSVCTADDDVFSDGKAKLCTQSKSLCLIHQGCLWPTIDFRGSGGRFPAHVYHNNNFCHGKYEIKETWITSLTISAVRISICLHQLMPTFLFIVWFFGKTHKCHTNALKRIHKTKMMYICNFHRMHHRKDWELAPELWVSQPALLHDFCLFVCFFHKILLWRMRCLSVEIGSTASKQRVETLTLSSGVPARWCEVTTVLFSLKMIHFLQLSKKKINLF